MCDGAGDPCDALCGGAGCGKCGGLSCEDGAATKASNALSVAQDASEILDRRERQVDELLRGVSTDAGSGLGKSGWGRRVLDRMAKAAGVFDAMQIIMFW